MHVSSGLGEPDYPPLLRAADTAPAMIAVRGRPSSPPALAIVGSRNASAAGLVFAEWLARGVAHHGYAIVSGLARGICGITATPKSKLLLTHKASLLGICHFSSFAL